LSTLLSVRMVNVSGRFNLQPSLVWTRLRYAGGLHEDMANGLRDVGQGNTLPARPAGEKLFDRSTELKIMEVHNVRIRKRTDRET
jgi:hypothetical protein